eukprot:CAMPEP_0114120930 /NCGR_PEP_ID=MMETSP0043_2-20121206/6912_1 /TAXON_ID=464988 /ORGANISM="Hemiselmis andersenii, Strain CCMP644" /LENGTH=31 /DNA_ID= /DNA_START= /DNA_END= /DNA_ORIENTATION=
MVTLSDSMTPRYGWRSAAELDKITPPSPPSM